jgi:hypothetical protein
MRHDRGYLVLNISSVQIFFLTLAEGLGGCNGNRANLLGESGLGYDEFEIGGVPIKGIREREELIFLWLIIELEQQLRGEPGQLWF